MGKILTTTEGLKVSIRGTGGVTGISAGGKKGEGKDETRHDYFAKVGAYCIPAGKTWGNYSGGASNKVGGKSTKDYGFTSTLCGEDSSTLGCNKKAGGVHLTLSGREEKKTRGVGGKTSARPRAKRSIRTAFNCAELAIYSGKNIRWGEKALARDPLPVII